MPVQHFAQPTASTTDGNQPITEIRWDFGYDDVEILESGNVIARIRDPNVLLSSGIDIVANSGDRFVIHVKKDTSAGPFAVFRNNIELVGGIPSWGVAASVAGKMVHLPNDLYQEKLAIRKNLERPIRIAQSWIGFSSLIALVFAYLSGIGSHYIPQRFVSSIETSRFSGVISALVFMALALAIQKRTAFFLLPMAQIFTVVQAVFVGNELMKNPTYPHFGGFRLFVSALSIWVLSDSWKTIRGHRASSRKTRKQNLVALAEIEKATVRDLASVAAERGHLLAWQQAQAAGQAGKKPSSHDIVGSSSFPSALDLLTDGSDPFAEQSPSRPPQPLVGMVTGASPLGFVGCSEPSTLSLQPASAIEASVVAHRTETPVFTSPVLGSSVLGSSVPGSPSIAAPPSFMQRSAAPSTPSASTGSTAPGGVTATKPLVFAQPFPESLATPVREEEAVAARITQPGQPELQSTTSEPQAWVPQAWVPPAAPLAEPTANAKNPSGHPLRGRVRSGL